MQGIGPRIECFLQAHWTSVGTWENTLSYVRSWRPSLFRHIWSQSLSKFAIPIPKFIKSRIYEPKVHQSSSESASGKFAKVRILTPQFVKMRMSDPKVHQSSSKFIRKQISKHVKARRIVYKTCSCGKIRSKRTCPFLWNTKTCLLLEREDMFSTSSRDVSSCGTMKHVFLWTKETFLLVDQADMLPCGTNDMLSCSARRHVLLFPQSSVFLLGGGGGGWRGRKV